MTVTHKVNVYLPGDTIKSYSGVGHVGFNNDRLVFNYAAAVTIKDGAPAGTLGQRITVSGTARWNMANILGYDEEKRSTQLLLRVGEPETDDAPLTPDAPASTEADGEESARAAAGVDGNGDAAQAVGGEDGKPA